MPHDIERVFSSTLGMLPPCYDKEGHRVGALLHAFSGEDERRLAAITAGSPIPTGMPTIQGFLCGVPAPALAAG